MDYWKNLTKCKYTYSDDKINTMLYQYDLNKFYLKARDLIKFNTDDYYPFDNKQKEIVDTSLDDGKLYWYINSFFVPVSARYNKKSTFDKTRKEIGNFFKNRQDCYEMTCKIKNMIKNDKK